MVYDVGDTVIYYYRGCMNCEGIVCEYLADKDRYAIRELGKKRLVYIKESDIYRCVC